MDLSASGTACKVWISKLYPPKISPRGRLDCPEEAVTLQGRTSIYNLKIRLATGGSGSYYNNESVV